MEEPMMPGAASTQPSATGAGEHVLEIVLDQTSVWGRKKNDETIKMVDDKTDNRQQIGVKYENIKRGREGL